MEKQIRVCQEKYLSSRTSEDLNELAKMLYLPAMQALSSFKKNRPDIFISVERGEAAAADAVSYLITRYINDPSFRINHSFYSYLKENVVTNIWNKKLQKIDRLEKISLSVLSGIGDESFEEKILDREYRDKFSGDLNAAIDYLIILVTGSDKGIADSLAYALEIKRHVDTCLRREKEYQSYLYKVKKEQRQDVVYIMESIKDYIKEYAGSNRRDAV